MVMLSSELGDVAQCLFYVTKVLGTIKKKRGQRGREGRREEEMEGGGGFIW